MQVIAFGGLARAGKSTAVNEIARWCVDNGFTPTRLSFAGPLKEAAAAIGAIKGSDTDALYRAFCQWAGNAVRDPEWVDGITGPNYWVRLMQKRIREAMDTEGAHLRDVQLRVESGDPNAPFYETVVLIDDLRFGNEIELVRRMGGKVIFIDASRRLDDLHEPWRQHESEKLATEYTAGALQDELFDWTVSNHQSRRFFIDKVIAMIPSWLNIDASEARR